VRDIVEGLGQLIVQVVGDGQANRELPQESGSGEDVRMRFEQPAPSLLTRTENYPDFAGSAR